MSITLKDIFAFEHANGSANNSIDYAVSFLPDTKSDGALEEYIKIRSDFYTMPDNLQEICLKVLDGVESWRLKYELMDDFVVSQKRKDKLQLLEYYKKALLESEAEALLEPELVIYTTIYKAYIEHIQNEV